MLLFVARLVVVSMLLLVPPSLRPRLRFARFMPMPPGPNARPGPRNPPPATTLLALSVVLFPRSLLVLPADAKVIAL